MRVLSTLLLTWSAVFMTYNCEVDSTEIFGPYPKTDYNREPQQPQQQQQQQSQSQNQQQNGQETQVINIGDQKQPDQSANYVQKPNPVSNPADLLYSTQVGTEPNTHMPLYLYNPALARKIGLSTLMMGGVLYGLSLIPAIMAISGVGPFAGMLGTLGKRRKRRSAYSYGRRFYYRELPYMSKDTTIKVLTMMENTMDMRKIDSNVCKKHYLCVVYKKALESEDDPLTLGTFEKAIIDTFGIAVERKNYRVELVPLVKMYYEAAVVGITAPNCTRIYPCTKKPKIYNRT